MLGSETTLRIWVSCRGDTITGRSQDGDHQLSLWSAPLNSAGSCFSQRSFRRPQHRLTAAHAERTIWFETGS